MRVKTFTGIDPTELDNQVNAWLAANRVVVRHASTALRPLRDRGPDALTGKTRTRRGIGLASTVWYEQAAKSRPFATISAGGARAAIAMAEIGPMPGTVISLRDTSSSRARRAISLLRDLVVETGEQV